MVYCATLRRIRYEVFATKITLQSLCYEDYATKSCIRRLGYEFCASKKAVVDFFLCKELHCLTKNGAYENVRRHFFSVEN